MREPLKDKNDIKIFILFLLDNLNQPMKYEDINDVVVQDGIVGSLDFAECFSELLAVGNVCEKKRQNRILYQITERGADVAKTLQSDLLSYIRTKSLKSAFRLLSFKDRGSEIKTSCREREDGKYVVDCSIIDRRVPLLEISIVADNEKQKNRMMDVFDDRPDVVYRGVMALLTGEIDYLIE